MNVNPIDSLPQSEWDALISSILQPFLTYIEKDPLISYEDLRQEAWIGLLNAAKNYDPNIKAKFSTYAYYYIRGNILHYIRIKTRLSPQRLDEDCQNIEVGYIDNSLENSELIDSIFRVISNEPNVDLLVEYYINGKTYRKIAKENDMSHQCVAMHIKRLRNLLSKRLKHENAQDDYINRVS